MSSIILEAKSLTKEYKQTLALDHINLQIKKGKIYGFIGQNGAGKTTFLRLVTGLAFPTTPRASTALSTAKQNRIAALSASGYSTSEIAEALGVSSTTVSKYLNGKE